MKISILQPRIKRGNIQKNATNIQRLINDASGDLLILAEYALTGSLVLDEDADVHKWAFESEIAMQGLSVPTDKNLLINGLITKDEQIYNACTLLPSYKIAQVKTYLDKPETDSGIKPGNGVSVFQMNDKKFIIIICSDLREIERIPTDSADMLLFIFHFTPENYENRIADLVSISKKRNLPILTASLTSDKNHGHSCYIFGSTIISLTNQEGILEITI